MGNWMWLGAKLAVVVKLGGKWVGNCMYPGETWEWWRHLVANGSDGESGEVIGGAHL